MLDRRSFLVTGAGLAAMSLAPRMAFAKAETDRRFVFIIQRGAADGLGTIGAVGDPAFAGARGVLGEDFATGKKLDSLFALHPAMPSLGGMYDGGEVLFAHAIASPYRDRSHFDGQNVLESGGTGAYQVKDGWMNRMLGVIPSGEAKAIAVSATIPLALRGVHEVTSYAPSALPQASDDLMARVAALYRGDGHARADRRPNRRQRGQCCGDWRACGEAASSGERREDRDDRDGRVGYARRPACVSGESVEGP